MRRVPRAKRRTVQAAAHETIFVCCECNTFIEEVSRQQGAQTIRECKNGHAVVAVRPVFIAFLQGLGWGLSLMIVSCIVALWMGSSRFEILAGAGAICSALAVKKMIDGMPYLKSAEPAKSVGRQRISEAAGAWIAILVSTLISTT
ncbi:MAG TPA: hypothetical protein VMF91_20705 [Bryobacteraceae bacterium]|nr:hypothetical protein [Bryobacteraceae bacterium]